MTKALMTSAARSPQAARCGGLAALAAALFLVLGAGEAGAAGRGGGETNPAVRSAELQTAGWQGHKHVERRHHRPYGRPQFHRHGRHGYSGQWYRGRGASVQACRPVTIVGWHHGRPALFGQLLCVNGLGQHFYLRGSQHLIRYLHR